MSLPLSPNDTSQDKKISVIICSVDSAKFRKVTQNYERLLATTPYEIIGIHDAKSLSEGYNRGIQKSTGSLLIFSHDDIEILSPDFSKKLRFYLNTYDLIGLAGTTRLIGPGWISAGPPYIHGQVVHAVKGEGGFPLCVYGVDGPVAENIQAIDGCFMAARRRVIESIRFDEVCLDGFHLYDIDFSFSAHLAGFQLAVCHDIIVIRASGGSFDKKWEHYAERFLKKHQARLFKMPQPSVYYPIYSISNKDDILPICLENTERDRRYAKWIAQHTVQETDLCLFETRMREQWIAQPIVHIVMALRLHEQTLLADSIDALGEQRYPHWRLSVVAPFPAPLALFNETEGIQWVEVKTDAAIIPALNQAIASVPADWVLWIDPGVRMEPHTLFAFADYADLYPQWHLIYADEDTLDEKGERVNPKFKPEINIDLLRSCPYLGYSLVRKATLIELGGYPPLPGAENYDMALRVIDQQGESAIGHISDILFHLRPETGRDLDPSLRQSLRAHLQRNALQGQIRGGSQPHTYQLFYQHETTPKVSIIIPTRDRIELLSRCLESLFEKTTYADYEVIVVDHQSADPKAHAFYKTQVEQQKIRLLSYPHPFNFSAICNRAAQEARGEYLLFLNNDTQGIDPTWLTRMMGHAQRRDVGIVGARLIYPITGRIQHSGMILGLGKGADRPYHRILHFTEPGYMGRMHLTQNLSAVTGACLLIRKTVFEEVSGFDEQRHKIFLGDVDLCLKVSRRGYKIVWTPDATLLHVGSATLEKELSRHTDWANTYDQEIDHLMEKALPQMAHDPAYNRHLSLLHGDYRIETALSPHWDPHFHDRPHLLGVPLPEGSGDYRIVAPFQALTRAGLAQCHAIPAISPRRVRLPTLIELERINPDTLVLHAPLSDLHLELLRQTKRFSKTRRIFTMDDLVTYRAAGHEIYPNVASRLRQALTLCDRLIVTTEPLAALCRGMISDIVVLPNYLEAALWESLTPLAGVVPLAGAAPLAGALPLTRQGQKPRVGWAGAQQHHADLEWLADLIEATADEIEWVFFGMCPDRIKPHAKEVHEWVRPFEAYAKKLAGLNLDLAIAPLAATPFNEAKSNLRLLEYGVLGIPVVCTDITPYRDAPVKRVENTPRAWIEAIRERINDLDATVKEGAALKHWVTSNYMLEDHLDEWIKALT